MWNLENSEQGICDIIGYEIVSNKASLTHAEIEDLKILSITLHKIQSRLSPSHEEKFLVSMKLDENKTKKLWNLKTWSSQILEKTFSQTLEKLSSQRRCDNSSSIARYVNPCY